MVVDSPELWIHTEKAYLTASRHDRDGGGTDEFPFFFPGNTEVVRDGHADCLSKAGRIVDVHFPGFDRQIFLAELDAYLRVGEVHEHPVTPFE